MQVLHAGKFDDSIAFWAETTAGQKRQGGYARKGGAERYWLGASHATLQKALKSVIGTSASNLEERTGSIWLPAGADGSPVPSTDLLVSGDVGQDAPAPAAAASVGRSGLRMFEVDTMTASGHDAVALLCAVMGKRTIKPGVIVGADLEYMADAVRLAGSIVARQQYLPDMAHRDGEYTAAWNPVLTGRDSERFEALARRMPDAVRAFADARHYEDHAAGGRRRGGGGNGKGAGTAAPSAPKSDVLLGILTGFVGSIIRQSASASKPHAFHRRKKFDSVHDSWLHKLVTVRPGALQEADAPQMLEQVREWHRPVTAMSESPLRFCFRLEEPAGKDGRWLVRYMVQSRDDPSLIVGAADAWESGSPLRSGGGNGGGGNIKEFLLTSMGQATGIFPGITSGLDGTDMSAGMEGCRMDSGEAYRFLTEEAPALGQAGYGVILPAWWAGRGARSGIRARAKIRPSKMKAPGALNLQSVVEFDWRIAVGGREISVGDLEKIVDAKSPLVMMRGEWTVMAPEDVERTLRFIKGHSRSKRAPLMDLIRMRFGLQQDAGGAAAGDGVGAAGAVDIEVTGGDSRVLQVLRRLDGRASLGRLGQPAGFSGRLRPYQTRGLSWLAFLKELGLGGCLADDMGLGKTIQVLALIQHHRVEEERGGGGRRKSKRPFLLICPTSVITNWQREAARFTPGLSVMAHHGGDRSRGAAFGKRVRGYDMVISSYGLLQRDVESIRSQEWAGVILDEAQHIKNPQTKQSRAARRLEASCRFALTGTPVENNIGDMWSIMEFLNPGFLGTQSHFRERFFVPIQSMQDESASEALRRATSPFVLRRLKTDKSIISDLPEKIEGNTYCQLTKEQASLYAATLKTIEDAISGGKGAEGGIARSGIILSSLAKLKQVCDHPAILLKDNSGITSGNGRARSGKMARLIEMLEEVIDAGDSALVFTQFVEMGHMLRRHIQETFGREVLFLHGGTPRKQRDEMVRRFQGDEAEGGRKGRRKGSGPEDGAGDNHGGGGSSSSSSSSSRRTSRIFVISLKAGGTGLNLTAASHVFHFDRWWNPAVEDQATDRAFRIGQKRNVQVHKMICSGTLEEKIDLMIEQKKGVARMVVGTGEAWLTKMSNDDLRDVLALSAEAVMQDAEGSGG